MDPRLSPSVEAECDGARKWQVVVGSAFALSVGNGPVVQFTFGVFLKPLSEGLGISRALASTALSVALLMTALAVPFVGHLADRYGTRSVALPSILGLSLTLACMGWFVQGPATLFAFSALLGLIAAGQSPVIYARAVVSWFDRHRGLALALAMTGVGIGNIVVPLLAAMTVDHFGWRGGYFTLALLVLAVAGPTLFVVRDGKRSSGFPGVSKEAAGQKGSARQTLIGPPFWRLAFCFSVLALAANGSLAHLIPMLTDRGVSPTAAAGSMGIVGLSLIVGRVLSGAALDRFAPGPVTLVIFCVVELGIILLIVAQSLPIAVSGAMCIGMGLGAEVDVLAFIVARLFGRLHFAVLYALLFAAFMVGSSLGPMIMGIGYEATGSYRLPLIFLAALMVAATYAARHIGDGPVDCSATR
jgi:MFS family permease